MQALFVECEMQNEHKVESKCKLLNGTCTYWIQNVEWMWFKLKVSMKDKVKNMKWFSRM
jgi:hypothetical protein